MRLVRVPSPPRASPPPLLPPPPSNPSLPPAPTSPPPPPPHAAENDHDGRGITFGRCGFTTGTGDGLELVQRYTRINPSNILAKYLPRMASVNGHDWTLGLSPTFERDVATAAATDPKFIQAQDEINDRDYFNPSQEYAKQIGAR